MWAGRAMPNCRAESGYTKGVGRRKFGGYQVRTTTHGSTVVMDGKMWKGAKNFGGIFCSRVTSAAANTP